jgi:hypothetical protein
MNNIEQFSLYTVKVFDILYASFPLFVTLDKTEIVSEYLKFDRHDDIEKLNLSKAYMEIVEMAGEDNKELMEIKAEVREKGPEIVKTLGSLERERENEKATQSAIYDGTLRFLESESLIRKDKTGYQLTSKSFSHLNKKFTCTTILDEGGTYISAIKNIFSTSSSISVGAATGAATEILTGLL